jgi:phosphatidate cytidylyltransferase
MGSALYFGGLYLFLLCLLISVAGLYELYKIYKIEKTPLGFVGFLTACGYYIALYMGADWAVMLVLTLGLMLAMAVHSSRNMWQIR